MEIIVPPLRVVLGFNGDHGLLSDPHRGILKVQNLPGGYTEITLTTRWEASHFFPHRPSSVKLQAAECRLSDQVTVVCATGGGMLPASWVCTPDRYHKAGFQALFVRNDRRKSGGRRAKPSLCTVSATKTGFLVIQHHSLVLDKFEGWISPIVVTETVWAGKQTDTGAPVLFQLPLLAALGKLKDPQSPPFGYLDKARVGKGEKE